MKSLHFTIITNLEALIVDHSPGADIGDVVNGDVGVVKRHGFV